MKKITLILAVIAIAFVSCKEDASTKIKKANLEKATTRDVANKVDAPVMEFEKTVHDWGVINEGDLVETKFKFKNTGKSELLITRIKGSCGCTVPSDWPRQPIMPGETGEFTVKFNSKGKPNGQQKTVTITCNTNKGRETVKIKAQVTPNPEEEKKREIRRKEAAEKRAKQAAEAQKVQPAAKK